MLALALVGSVLAIVFGMDDTKDGIFWGAYTITGVLLCAGLLGMVGFFLLGIFKSSKKLIRFLIGLAVAVVVLVGLYFVVPGTITDATAVKYDLISEGFTVKAIEAAIYLVYALIVGATLSIIYVECSKAFKKK